MPPERTASEDDGSPDPRLHAALTGGAPTAEVLAALVTARVFLPLAAQALATEPSAVAGLRQESAAQMALLSLVSPEGLRALPAFLAAADVPRWRPDARPVPVSGAQACRTVLEDGATALLLDPAGAAVPVAGALLAELAAGRVPVDGALSTRTASVELVAGAADPALLAALPAALAGEPVTAARLLAGPDGPVLGLVTGLAPAELVALASRVRVRLGPALPAQGLDLAVVAPDGPGQPVPLPAPPPARWWRRRR